MDRPHTARPSASRPRTPRLPNTGASDSYDEEDVYSSSDGEDVFAFLPPNTADGQTPPISQPTATPSTFVPNFSSPAPGDPGPSNFPSNGPYGPQQRPQTSSSPNSLSHNRHPSQRPRYQVPGATSSHSEIAYDAEKHGDIKTSTTESRLSSEDSRGVRNYEREDSIKMEFDLGDLEDEEEDSPWPEVRVSVSNIDDPGIPAMTIRMWAVGMLLCIMSSAMNVFFSLRSPAPKVVPLLLLLLAFPIGRLFALVLPIRTWRLPKWLGSIEFSLNPGPWNIKEHVLVYIMANVAVGAPYALNAVIAAEKFYGITFSPWFSIVLVLSTELTGFGLAGLCRRYLVKPANMIWPQNLVVCSLLNTLHADEETGGITRCRFFWYTMAGGFCFYLFPGLLFKALSTFSFVCWIWPKNKTVNALFGVSSGLGMSVISFDWTQITWIGSPLVIPWWAEVNVAVGFVVFYWLITPILWFTNAWYIGHFPISGVTPYDRFGKPYNITNVLHKDGSFDLASYEAYSPMYLTAPYATTYLIAFALTTCILTHTALYHGRSLWDGLRNMDREKSDIHEKLMSRYPEVPDWWYLVFFFVFFGLGIVAITVWDTEMPVWALFLAALLPTVYIVPTGFIYAVTGQEVSLNLVAQIIPGALIPGKPLPNMIFKAFAAQTLFKGTSFVQDLKLGHYVKIAPRSTFVVQAVATIIAGFIQVGVKEYLFWQVKDICEPYQASRLTCPINKVFFSASAVWGVIGPSRQFGKGTIYEPHLFALLVGAFLPVPFWLLHKRYPKSIVKYINVPVVLNGVSFIPPALGINYSSWFLVAFIFQYVIRRKNFMWWSKFNYILSAALDSGTFVCVFFLFFALEIPKNGVYLEKLRWAGNTIFENTLDYNPTALYAIPEGGIR